MRARDERFKRAEVDIYDPVIYSVAVSRDFAEILFAAFSLEEGLCCFVSREDGCCCAELCTHVGDCSALGNRKCLYAFAAPLNDVAYAALYGKNAKDFKAYVLCRNEGSELSCQVYLDHLRHGDVVSAAAHCNGHIKSACAERKHSYAAGSRSMAVGTDECFSGSRESFKLNLMADSVARPGEPDAVLGRYGLYVSVVVGVFKA